jgi:hypothetical protein
LAGTNSSAQEIRAGLKSGEVTRHRTVLYFLFYVIVSLFVLFYQGNNFEASATYGLLVPDVVNLGRVLEYGSVRDPFSDDNDIIGIALLYGWLWDFAPTFAFVINDALVLSSLLLVRVIFVGRSSVPALASLGIILNPYLYLANSGPNKEIPLIALTLLFVLVLMRRPRNYLLYALAIASVAYLFRDGYGALLALFAFCFVLTQGRASLITAGLFIICFAASASYGFLVELVPFVARNYSFVALNPNTVAVGVAASVLGFDANTFIGGSALFGMRLLYNLLSLALLPSITNIYGDLFAIGLAYWVVGELILTTFLACLFVTVRGSPDRDIALMASFALVVLFTISVSIFVQPRYLIPVLPLTVGVLASQSRDVRTTCIMTAAGLSLAVIYAYYLLQRSPGPWTPAYFEQPSFLQFL